MKVPRGSSRGVKKSWWPRGTKQILFTLLLVVLIVAAISAIGLYQAKQPKPYKKFTDIRHDPKEMANLMKEWQERVKREGKVPPGPLPGQQRQRPGR